MICCHRYSYPKKAKTVKSLPVVNMNMQNFLPAVNCHVFYVSY